MAEKMGGGRAQAGEGRRVAIFGGGAAGLTVAQELAERGFEVTVFEASRWGGKLSATSIAGTGEGQGRRDLPVEHGFHFFPTFYRHVPDTMRRIPLPGEDRTVYDRLVQGDFEYDAEGDRSWSMPSRFAPTLRWAVEAIRGVAGVVQGIPLGELAFLAGRELKFLSACSERKLHEFGNVNWWDWNESDDKTAAFQELVDRMVARNLLATPARQADAPTMAQSFINMLYSGLLPFQNIDRALDDDASSAWVDPWCAHLKNLGVRLVLPGRLLGLRLDADGKTIAAADVETDSGRESHVADYYVVAVPVEQMTRLLTPELVRAAPSLAAIPGLCTRSMSGVSLFLTEPMPVVRGHVAYEDSAWALTSVSQSVYWHDLDNLGAGNIKEVFSVILSDWDTPGTEVVFKPARDCTKEELTREMLAQLNRGLVKRGQPAITENIIARVGIDKYLRFAQNAAGHVDNEMPLFTSTAGTLATRPGATTEIPNFFIASDYLATSASFGCAEGANQGGRMAANGVLQASASPAPRVRIWPPIEPLLLAPARWLDRYRYRRGKPQISLPLPGLGPVRTTGHASGVSAAEVAPRPPRPSVAPQTPTNGG